MADKVWLQTSQTCVNGRLLLRRRGQPGRLLLVAAGLFGSCPLAGGRGAARGLVRSAAGLARTRPRVAATATAAEGGAPPVSRSVAPGTVYFVATPIGNYDDITLRALRVLRDVDVIAAEDTRRTGLLLAHHGIAAKKLVSHHEHNARASVPELVRRARDEGDAIALVSDAGTPGVSDPGAQLAAACAKAGVPCVPLPGACAAVAALSVAGAVGEWVFFGFVPSAGAERKRVLARIAAEARACVLYEAPHRLLSTLRGLVEADGTAAAPGEGTAGARRLLCARELTKLHEELFRGSLDGALRHYAEGGAGVLKGEFTLVLLPDESRAARDRAGADDERERRAADLLAAHAAAGARLSAAVRDVCEQTGSAKRLVYAQALEIWRGRDEGADSGAGGGGAGGAEG